MRSQILVRAALCLCAASWCAAEKSALPPDAVASVNGQIISRQLFENLLRNDRGALQATGEIQAAKLEQLPAAVLEELIDRALIAQEVMQRKIAPSETDLAAEETKMLQAFNGEKAFADFLRENNLTREEYRREIIGSGMNRDRLVQALAAENPITPAQIDAAYEARKSDPAFQLPERVAVAHININLRRDRLAARLQQNDPQLNGDALEKAIDAEKANRQKLATDLLQQLKAGADFGTLAAKYSDDPGSRGQGGELPAFPRRAHPREFEEAAFALTKPGELSAVIEDFYGYHILKLREHLPARVATREEASGELRTRLEREEQAALFHGWLHQARARAVIIKRPDLPFS